MEQRGLNAAAPSFTPTSFGGAAHASQPAIGRRSSCNPTFTTPTKLNRGSSMRAANGKGFGKQQQHQNAQQGQRGQDNTKKQHATSFANEAFARKDAMKAFAAKKMAAQRAAGDRGAANAADERLNRKLAAQKGFARRHSQKMNKRNAAKQKAEAAQSTTPKADHSTSTSSDVKHADKLQVLDSYTAPQEHPQRSTDKENNPGLFHHTSSTSTSSTHSDPAVPKHPTPASSAPASPRPAVITPSLSGVTDVAADDAPAPEEPAKPSLSIEAVAALTIAPRTPPLSAVSSEVSSGLSSGLSSHASARAHELSHVAGCAVDISAAPRLSAVSSSDSSGPAHRARAAPPSSGKWCPNCAGVGLHVAALLAELGKQPRPNDSSSSSSSRPTTGAGASGSLSSKNTWKRRVSQTIIGDRGAARAAAEQRRLQQQVDVLTTTVAFLYEKLQAADSTPQDVDDAYNQCCVRR